MGRRSRSIPDRWLDYKPIGEPVFGTTIVAFKVPLRLETCQKNLPDDDQWFTPAMLLEQSPMIKTVIDLTNTHRYYNPKEEFGTKGVDHVKILVQGNGKIPPSFQIRRFFDVMDQHMEKYGDSTDALVGVHCTHGLNRTGYFVCRWMVDRLKMRPDDAIAYFNEARGHDMERVPYLNELRLVLPFIPSSPAPRRRVSYVSPLEDASYDEVPTESRYSRRIGGTRFRH
ncbi:RNA/RNP complex-1-interacting phosphatase [Dendroctonus ponderosae]|uniref:Tyrosine specific protein phosphatases domain-containing protein n=1 Tax=Dendroctonus ponderosae TaxID=77166 RepID=J3JYW8_DENPD|nr:RNA/RNP complex-1-interacting phosphatase [Dendroctonus ponderosae]AEE63406.1 unknown [Dendroctonus ponderosae]